MNSKYITVDLDKQCVDGGIYQVRTNRYCVVDELGHLVCYKDIHYPQCNTNKRIAERLLDICKNSGGPGVEVVFYDMIMIEYDTSEYY